MRSRESQSLCLSACLSELFIIGYLVSVVRLSGQLHTAAKEWPRTQPSLGAGPPEKRPSWQSRGGPVGSVIFPPALPSVCTQPPISTKMPSANSAQTPCIRLGCRHTASPGQVIQHRVQPSQLRKWPRWAVFQALNSKVVPISPQVLSASCPSILGHMVSMIKVEYQGLTSSKVTQYLLKLDKHHYQLTGGKKEGK